jgi:hypothetical protein
MAVAALLSLCGPALSQQAEPQPDPAPAAVAPPQTEAGAITLELNKLTPVDRVCQAYFVVENQTPQSLQDLTIDTYLFDKNGVILRGLALQFVEVPSGRATVVPFELPDLPCADITRVLLNKVTSCTAAGGAAVERCADLLKVRTRAEVTFEY